MKQLYKTLSKYVRYPWSHTLVAYVGNTLVFTLCTYLQIIPFSAFSFFYLGREVRDLEKSHDWDMSKFDWKGLHFGFTAFVIADILRIILLTLGY